MAYKQLGNDIQTQVDKLFDELVTLERRLEEAEAEIKRLKAALNNKKVTEPKLTPYNKEVFDHEFERLEGRVPPEKKPELQASKSRISAAVDLFSKNFDVDGNPTSEVGNKLTKKYGWMNE